MGVRLPIAVDAPPRVGQGTWKTEAMSWTSPALEVRWARIQSFPDSGVKGRDNNLWVRLVNGPIGLVGE